MHLRYAVLAGLLLGCSDSQSPGGTPLIVDVLTTTPLVGTPYDTIVTAISARVSDPDHHPLAGQSVAWTSTDGGSFVPAMSVTNSDGVAEARWILGPGVGTQHASMTVEGSPLNHADFTATADAFRAKSLSIGDGEHHCAIDAVGKVWCWGPNESGELGDGTTNASAVPVAVHLDKPATQVGTSLNSVGATCALTTAGEVYCWGTNGFGELGNGTTSPSLTPVRVGLPALTFKQISVRNGGSCAVSVGGEAYCWGRNEYGRFGNGGGLQNESVLTPTLVSGGYSWQQIAVGYSESCGVRTDRHVYCWGFNQLDLLDLSSSGQSLVPLPVVTQTLMDSMTMSLWHWCGTTTAHETYCWGSNRNIGFDPAPAAVTAPAALASSPVLQSVHAGIQPTFALGVDGKVYWWGPPNLATGGGPLTPFMLSPSLTFSVIGTGAGDMCAIQAGTDVVFCWSNFSNDSPTYTIRAVPAPQG